MYYFPVCKLSRRGEAALFHSAHSGDLDLCRRAIAAGPAPI